MTGPERAARLLEHLERDAADAVSRLYADQLTDADRAAIIAEARHVGLRGFGGTCGEAALALRDRLFPDGRLVAAVNAAFWSHDRFIGHVAVEDAEGRFWDMDGRPKDWEEIEHWGMLDPEDPDWEEAATDLGAHWDATAAEDTLRVPFDAAAIHAHFGKKRAVDARYYLDQGILRWDKGQREPRRPERDAAGGPGARTL